MELTNEQKGTLTAHMRFENLIQTDSWRNENRELLIKLHTEVAAVGGVEYTETWLCGASPSFVAGFGDDDQMIVCFPI